MDGIFHGITAFLLYFIIAASVALLLRRFVHIKDEVFRKGLHCILLGSLLVLVFSFSVWWQAVLSAVGFAVAVYPILWLLERVKGFSAFVTERTGGELKRSLLIVFLMFAVELSVCWGWLGDKLLVLACIYAWGFGDAAAALIGKRFGRHALTGGHIEGRKSVEGSLAMFAVSFICVGVILALRGGLPLYGYILIPALTAIGVSVVELFSLHGMDTITCPLAATAVLLPMLHLIGGGI